MLYLLSESTLTWGFYANGKRSDSQTDCSMGRYNLW